MDDRILVKCRFLDSEGNPKGREYTYLCEPPIGVGDTVYTITTQGESKLVVTEINVPWETVEAFKDKLKAVYKTPIEQAEKADV